MRELLLMYDLLRAEEKGQRGTVTSAHLEVVLLTAIMKSAIETLQGGISGGYAPDPSIPVVDEYAPQGNFMIELVSDADQTWYDEQEQEHEEDFNE